MGDSDEINSTEANEENPEDRKARCFFVVTESYGELALPPGETPSTIYQVYNFDESATGQGQTVALISAYNYPTALADFNTFSSQFGLPVETSTNAMAATNKVFQVINARGVTPALDAGWAVESALDIEWAHAMAPSAKIVLVQAGTNAFVDLFQAVDVANAIPGIGSVCMGWGGYEWSEETAFDVHLKQPGVIYAAGAGDKGGQSLYPAVSQYVMAVGGTRINRTRYGNFVGETGWSDGGGGPSIFIPIPAYQAAQPSVAAKCGSHRGTPDIAFDADPASGVAIYDSTPYKGISGWIVIGGTSLSAPCWAGVIACINGHRTEPFQSTADFLTQLYNAGGSAAYPAYFRDIVEGKAGLFSCSVGWDFVTGWGTPNIRNLIKLLG